MKTFLSEIRVHISDLISPQYCWNIWEKNLNLEFSSPPSKAPSSPPKVILSIFLSSHLHFMSFILSALCICTNVAVFNHPTTIWILVLTMLRPPQSFKKNFKQHFLWTFVWLTGHYFNYDDLQIYMLFNHILMVLLSSPGNPGKKNKKRIRVTHNLWTNADSSIYTLNPPPFIFLKRKEKKTNFVKFLPHKYNFFKFFSSLFH